MKQEIKSSVEELILENLEALKGDRSYGDESKDKARRACLNETLSLLDKISDAEIHAMEAKNKAEQRELEKRKNDDATNLEWAKLHDPWRKVIEIGKVVVPATVSIATLGFWALRTAQMLRLNETGTVHTRTSLENLSFPKIGK